MNFKPSSNQFMPSSCQLRVGQYARTISNDSPAPHSYYPTMGRRQRRQPINPPRHRRMGVLNPGSTSLRRASAKLNGRAAALAGPLAPTGSHQLPPTFGRLFAPDSRFKTQDSRLNPQSSIHHALGGAAVTRRRRPQLLLLYIITIVLVTLLPT